MTVRTDRAMARALPPEPLAPRAPLVAQLRAAPRIAVVRGPLGSGKSALAALAAREDMAEGRVVIWRDVAHEDDAEGLLADVNSALPGGLDRPPSTLVLNDLDRAADPHLVPAVIELAATSPELRIVVTTRRRLALESVLTRARVPVVVVGPDLAFTAEDVAALLPERSPSADVVRRLLVHTDGHALTLRTLLHALQDRRTHPGLAPPERMQALATELAREILEANVAPSELTKLSRLAVPGQLTVGIADVAAADARDLMARAEELGIGVWRQQKPFGEVTEMLAIPRPLRAALLAELRASEPDVVVALTKAVTEAALERGDLMVAGFAAVEARDPALLDRVCREGWTHLRDGDVMALADATVGVADWQLDGYPSAALAAAVALRLQPARAHLSPQLFEIAARSVALLSPEEPTERAYLGTVQSIALRFLGDLERSHDAGSRALAAIRTAQEIGEPLPGLGFMLRNIGMSAFLAGETGDAAELLLESQAAEEPGTPSEVLTGVLRALVLAWAGEIASAEALVAGLPTEYADVALLGGYTARALLDARAIIALERDDREGYDDAQDALARLPARVDELAGIEAVYQATRATYAGDITAAQAVVDRALTSSTSALLSPAWRGRLAALRALIRSAIGGPVNGPATEGEPGPDEDHFARLLRAAALVASGELQQAEAIVHDPRRTAPTDVALQILVALLSAVLAARAGNTAAARRHVAYAVDLGNESQSRRMWLALTAADRALLESIAPGAAPANLETPFPEMLGTGAPEATGLTTREFAVLRQLARGASTRDAAEALQVSVNTVKTQLKSLYRKLGVSSRADALRRARELELI